MAGARAEGATADDAGLVAVEHTVDERRLRAFAAGVGDFSAPLFDLDSPDGIVAHPVFPVVLEWPLVVAGPPGLGLDDDAVHAGLHVSHEIAWHRPIRPGDALRTSGRIETLDSARPACSPSSFSPPPTPTVGRWSSRARASSTAARPWTPRVTDRRRARLPAPAGPRRSPGPEPAAARRRPTEAAEPFDDLATFRVEEADAVVYSECSGIWNPIHTDPRAARLAGLPRPVLHGTATLARVVSALVETRLEGDPTRVARLGCRFTAPIYPGDRATVAATDPHRLPGAAHSLAFTARKDDGTAILDAGFIELT